MLPELVEGVIAAKWRERIPGGQWFQLGGRPYPSGL